MSMRGWALVVGRLGGHTNGCNRVEGDNNDSNGFKGFDDDNADGDDSNADGDNDDNTDDDDNVIWEWRGRGCALLVWGWGKLIRPFEKDDLPDPGNRRCWFFLEAILPACSTRLWAGVNKERGKGNK